MKGLFSKKNVKQTSLTQPVEDIVVEKQEEAPKIATPMVAGSPVIILNESGSAVHKKRTLVCKSKLEDKETNEGTDAYEQSYSLKDELSEQLKPALNDKKFSDAVILCGKNLNSKFYVHRFVLSGRSTYFERVYSETANQQPLHKDRKARFCLERSDIDAQVMTRVLEYCYTGVVKLGLNNVLEVLALAEEFGIRGLKNSCQRYLTQNIDADNACQFLETSIKFNAGELTEFVLNYIDKKESICAVLKSEGCSNLWKDTLIRIISRDSLQLKPEEEVLVFDAVMNWKNKPSEREEIFNHVRFPLMSSQQISDKVEPTKAVNQELLFEAYRHHLVPQQANTTQARFRNRGLAK